jgi:hypothetical protein
VGFAGYHLEDSKPPQLQPPFTGKSIADAVKQQLNDSLGVGLSDLHLASNHGGDFIFGHGFSGGLPVHDREDKTFPILAQGFSARPSVLQGMIWFCFDGMPASDYIAGKWLEECGSSAAQ